MSEKPKTLGSTGDYIESVLSTILFEDVLKATWQKGAADFAVIVGPNASGKSVFRRLVSMKARDQEAESIHLSMEGRTDTTTGVVRAFLYGDEHDSSTGHLSANLVIGGISTALGRDSPHVIFWDEPDVGLSDEYAAGAAQAIVKFVKEKKEHTKAVFVVTHRRSMVLELAKANPHVVLFGGEHATLHAWLTRAVVARPIEKLPNDGHATFTAILTRLDKAKKGATT